MLWRWGEARDWQGLRESRVSYPGEEAITQPVDSEQDRRFDGQCKQQDLLVLVGILPNQVQSLDCAIIITGNLLKYP